jgi:hypothetical protein
MRWKKKPNMTKAKELSSYILPWHWDVTVGRISIPVEAARSIVSRRVILTIAGHADGLVPGSEFGDELLLHHAGLAFKNPWVLLFFFNF